MTKTKRMEQIPCEERPYEKFQKYGVKALSDTELLAMLLRSGTSGENVLELSGRILYDSEEPGLLSLHLRSYQDLKKIKGVGNVKAAQIVCLSELSKRLARCTPSEGIYFREPETVANYFMEDLCYEKQEVFKLVMLNTKGKLLRDVDISRGTVNETVLSPREVYMEALSQGAVSIIAIHNHPSGDPNPSQQDVLITRRLYEAGELLGVQFLDHIIIGHHRYYSFLEEGQMQKGS